MANEVQGIDCLFELNTGGGYLPFVCAKAFTLSLETEVVETLGIGDGFWSNADYDFHRYNISLSGVMKIIETNKITTVDLLALQMGFSEVYWRAIYLDKAGITKVASGTALITSTSLNVSAGGLVDTPISMIGKGAFTLADTTAVCAGSITNIVTGLGASANSRVFTLTGVTINMLRIDYVVDGGATNSYFPAAGANQFAIEYAFTTGTHNIVFTPICPNGAAGTPYTITGLVI